MIGGISICNWCFGLLRFNSEICYYPTTCLKSCIFAYWRIAIRKCSISLRNFVNVLCSFCFYMRPEISTLSFLFIRLLVFLKWTLLFKIDRVAQNRKKKQLYSSQKQKRRQKDVRFIYLVLSICFALLRLFLLSWLYEELFCSTLVPTWASYFNQTCWIYIYFLNDYRPSVSQRP